MNRRSLLRAGISFGGALLFDVRARAADDFRPLFNGRDLAGWVPVNVAPETFTVRDGLIVSTGKPTGVLRTERMYENFILELEWRHMVAGGNAGLFVWSDALPARGVPFTRSLEVQILDGHDSVNATSHGDVFSIHGATMTPDRPHPAGWSRCLPSEKRARPSPEWNHYRVTCRDGLIRLAVNGKEVSGGTKSRPRKGYLCLESEGSECHFRNLRIQELPSTIPSADETATADDGFKSLYSGLDLRGWSSAPGSAGQWQAKDWMLDYKGDGSAKELRTLAEFADCTLMVDWRVRENSGKNEPGAHGAVLLRGSPAAQIMLSSARGGTEKESEAAARAARPAGQWNRSVATIQGDRLTVVLNEQTIVDRATVSGAPARGPIVLRPASGSIQFANLFIKALG